MKKHSLLMLLPFALTLSGCGGLSKGSIINEKFMRRNFGQETEIKREYVNPEVVQLNFEEGATVETTAAYDLFKVTKDGVVGYYNVTTNAYALPLSEGVTSELSFNNETPVRLLSGVKTVEEKEILVVYDDFGNKLYEGKKDTLKPTFTYVSEDKREDQEFVFLNINLGTNTNLKAVAVYNRDGSFKQLFSREDFIEKYKYYDYGTSLAIYGHKDYFVSESEYEDEYRYSVFNSKKEKYVSSFTIPESRDSYFAVGDKMFYQIRELLPQRAKKYDFSVNENKYALTTYKVDVLTGKTSTVKTNFVFSTSGDFNPLVNEKGIYEYTYVSSLKEINKDKTLNQIARDVIIDDNLKVCADVTGVGLMNFAQFGKDYFINNKGVIYDLKLREVGLLRNTQAGLGRVLRFDSKYGLVNHVGEFIEAPLYTAASSGVEEEYYRLENKDGWKYVKVNDNEQVEVLKELSKEEYTSNGSFSIYDYYTRISDSKTVVFNSLTGEEVTIPETPEGTLLYGQSLNRLLGSVYESISVFEKDGKYTVARIVEKRTTTFVFPTIGK